MQMPNATSIYHAMLRHIMSAGGLKGDRTGTGTRSTFAYQMRFDLLGGKIPLVTTKKIHTKSIIEELLWFLQGGTNVKDLQEKGVRIWNEWAKEDGSLPYIYGQMWREFPVGDGTTFDQITDVVNALKTNPDSRRHIVCAWHPKYSQEAALPPCHTLFQFYVWEGWLSCQLYQRSADAFLGVPFNIASYGILTHMVAKVCGLRAKEFIWTGGDCHIYNDHVAQVNEQLSRDPHEYSEARLNLPERDSLFDYAYEDFDIEGYQSFPAIKATVSV